MAIKKENEPHSYYSDPDVKLMLAFQSGEMSVFDQLLTKYFKHVMNFIYRYTGNRESAEDLTQEVFIRVYKSRARYTPKAKFKTWLFTIARNVSLNELRKHKQRVESLDKEISVNGEKVQREVADTSMKHPHEMLIEKEQARLVRTLLLALPEKQRGAMILRKYEGMSYDEIAESMHMSSKAIKSLLHRARENLKDIYRKHMGREK